MTDNYKVGYSVDALDDLREIYAYIADELLVSETAATRIFYGGRDIEGIINSNN